MATLLVISKSEKERAARIAALIEDGKLPKPPNADHDAHKCADCGGFTILMPLCTDCAIKADQEAMKKRVTCDLCKSPANIRYPFKGAQYICKACFDAWCQWQEVLQMAESVAPSTIGYDANCGMSSEAEFIAELADAIRDDKNVLNIVSNLIKAHIIGANLAAAPERVISYQNALGVLKTLKTQRPKVDSEKYLRWCEERWLAQVKVANLDPINRDVRPEMRQQLLLAIS